MKVTLPFIIILFLSQLAIAQVPSDNNTQKPATNVETTPTVGKGKISGTVIDSATAEPLEFTTITLIDVNTGKPVDGNICDEKGNFSLNKIKEGSYKLQIAFMGYEKKEIEDINISEKKEVFSLGSIRLASSEKQMKEVVVEGKRDLIEEKVDRTVYNAENDATNKGGDATDVLRKVPMLSVDMDGNVSMRGSQNLKVLINNKPSTITAGSVADALKQIPADLIKSVEVITSPSAKYDAEGSAGIINIILKKNTLEGFSLNVNGSGGVRGSNLGLNGSYRKGKMGFSLGGNGRFGYNTPGGFDNRQVTTTGGVQTTNVQQATTRNQYDFGQYSLGWDYDINKNNSISAGAKYSFRNGITNQDNLFTQNFRNDTLQNVSTRNVESTNLSGTLDANVNYTHLFKKPQREFNLLALYSRNNRNNDFTNNIMNNDDLSAVLSRLKNVNESFNQEMTIQADYQTPIGKTQILEVGAKEILRKVSSSYSYLYANGSDGPFLPSTSSQLSNVFSYNQNITASYLSYTLNLPKGYSVKAGARYEYTSIDANFQSQQNVVIPSYSVLVPSINISKKLENGSMIKASFNRRIQRPSLQYLNPNIQASNPLSATIGNPQLQPEYTNNYELAYSTYIKNNSITFSSFMRNTNNSIQSVRDVTGDTIRTTYQNIGKEDAYGISIFTNVSLSEKFTLNGGTDIYYAVLNNNVPNPLYTASNQGWVASYRLSATYNFTKEWAMQLFGFYRGRQVQLQGYQGGFGIYSLSLKRDFNNKKGSIGFGAENFFTPSFHINSTLNSPVIAQSSTTILHNMNFKINFSYSIGKMKSGDEKRKRRSGKSVNNDDLKDGGDFNPANGMQQNNSNQDVNTPGNNNSKRKTQTPPPTK